MATYTLKRLDTPVTAYFLGITKDFDIITELDALNRAIIEKFDADDREQFVFIVDAREMQISLNKIMMGVKTTNDAGFNPNHHPKVTKTIIIADNAVLKFSMDGLHKLGMFQDADLVNDYDEAIALAKEA